MYCTTVYFILSFLGGRGEGVVGGDTVNMIHLLSGKGKVWQPLQEFFNELPDELLTTKTTMATKLPSSPQPYIKCHY